MLTPSPRLRLAALLALPVVAAACGGDKGTAPGPALGSITAQSALATTGRAGQFAVDSPVVKVVTAAGAPVAGLPITFSIVSGGGSVVAGGTSATTATVTTDANGVAGLRWRLGGTVGAQQLRARVDTFPGVTFGATVSAGPTAQLVVVAGDNQAVAPNGAVPVAPQVRARDAFGNNVVGDTIDLTVGLGPGTLPVSRLFTDANGLVTINGWAVGKCGGANTITATSRAVGRPTVDVTANVSGGDAYCIELVYVTFPDTSLKGAVERAAARWAKVITQSPSNELVNNGNFNCAGITGLSLANKQVKSVLIYVQLAPIPSSTPGLITLGSAGPCFIRTTNGLTIVGGMRLNSDFLLNNQTATQREDVVLHEMGHILGFGTLWQGIGGVPGLPVLLINAATSSGTGNPTFTGGAAIAEYLALGAPPGSNGVPVENCGGGGTINGHWKEGVLAGPAGTGFGTELMTGYASAPAGTRNPFSRMSIAAMSDMGYSVDLSQADAYTLNSQACPATVLLPAPDGRPQDVTVQAGNYRVREELERPSWMVGRGRTTPLIRR